MSRALHLRCCRRVQPHPPLTFQQVLSLPARVQDASLPLYQAGLPAECALLTQLRQLVIRNVGAGYRHLPPSLSALTLDLVDCEPEPPDSNGEGGIPDLRHLAQLCRLSLPDYKVSAGVELLPDSLTRLEMDVAGEAFEHDFGWGVDYALPEALSHLTRLQSLRMPQASSGFEHLPLSLTELVIGIDGPPVPPPLARLTAQRRLDMGWGLQHLPPGVTYLT